MGPASVPGCTSSLAPAAFTPGSGTTSTIGVGASVAVTVPVNTATIASGTCAGIQVCYAPVSPVAVTPMCCTTKIRCPRRIDPWIQMGSARTVITPGSVVGLPVTFTNTDTKPMVQSLTFTDDSGLLTFRRCCPGDIVLARKPNAGEIDPVISNEAPLTVSLAVGETQTITVFAHYAGSRVVTVEPPTADGKLNAVALASSNQMELRVFANPAAGHALLVARLDNLGKGASGAAVQNLELMLGR
jgi:hypothetical protein